MSNLEWPALCSSRDGVTGEVFPQLFDEEYEDMLEDAQEMKVAHPVLTKFSPEDKRVDTVYNCGTCPLNQWSSG